MTKHLRNFLNGLAFGITETVPGVSGGTIAIILGFYDELISSVNHFTENYRKSIRYFIPLLLGMATGIVVFSSITNYFLTNHSFPTMLFFIGLVTGIVPLVYSKVKTPGRMFNPKELLLIAIPILALALMSNLKTASITSPAEVIDSITVPFMFFILVSGIVAAAALVIPGVSGSFVLLLLGIYPLAIFSVSNIRYWLLDITNTGLMLDICKVLVPLAIGVLIGGITMARLIEKFLKSYYKAAYSIILGLLIGSVCVLLKDPIVFQSGVTTPAVVIGVVTFAAGCVLSFSLGKKRL